MGKYSKQSRTLMLLQASVSLGVIGGVIGYRVERDLDLDMRVAIRVDGR